MFIARISRGRTIREFIAGTLFVPTALTFVWLVVFGNSAIYSELLGQGEIAVAVSQDISTALFVLLSTLPGSLILIPLAVVVVLTFFVTSANSGALVIDQLTAATGFDSPAPQRMFWALLEGGVAVALLLGGGLVAIQTAAITTALPLCIIMLFMCRSLFKALRAEAVKDPNRALADVPGEVHEPEAGVGTRPGRFKLFRRVLNLLTLKRWRENGGKAIRNVAGLSTRVLASLQGRNV